MANIVGRNAFLLSTDVNEAALEKTRNIVSMMRCSVIRADLFSCLRPAEQFSLVVFNPPYVPTDDEEYCNSLRQRDISASWAGGRNGRQVTDRFLKDLLPYLTPDGTAYLVVIDLNDVRDTISFASHHGLVGEIVGERAAGIEKLYVLRLTKAGPVNEDKAS